MKKKILFGKRNGEGKKYDINGNLISIDEYYAGDIKKGKKDLKHCAYSEMQIKNGVIIGKVKKYERKTMFRYELIYEGEYIDRFINRKVAEY